MTNSFSVVDYKGNNVTGTILFEGGEFLKLVADDDGTTLWIVDCLDDVGVSLDCSQLAALLPHLQKWIGTSAATHSISEAIAERALKAALHTIEGYRHGNDSHDLADEVLPLIREALQPSTPSEQADKEVDQ